MSHTIVFDVNETLLDLGTLDPHFERVFGDAAARRQWFAQVLQSALVATLTGAYTDFGTIGGAALDVTAARRDTVLPGQDRAAILGGMLTLAPHPEVRESLERLHCAGLRLATLTNSTTRVAEQQLTHAGLYDFFERILSVETVGRFKPAAETYRMAASELGIELSEMRLVAAHDWDVTGALRAGCAAAFVARPGMVLGSLAEQPDITGRDLSEVVDQILGAARV
jgi:2-haloacid dehalogenase